MYVTLKLLFLKLILPDLMTNVDLSNRPIYGVLNTYNLLMFLQLKYMPMVINPARIASFDWKS